MNSQSLVRLCLGLRAEIGDTAVSRLTKLLRSGAVGLSRDPMALTATLRLGARATASVSHLFKQAVECGYSPRELATMLECVLDLGRSSSSEYSELVYTAPRGIPCPGRRTQDVIIELIRDARTDIVLLGYLMTVGAGPVVRELYGARERGVQVLIVANSEEMLRDGLGRLWPSGHLRPALYYRPDLTEDLSSMHAKTLIVDAQRMLVTSANMTSHGLSKNIELGVLVEGRACRDARELIARLIEAGVFRPCG